MQPLPRGAQGKLAMGEKGRAGGGGGGGGGVDSIVSGVLELCRQCPWRTSIQRCSHQ